MKISVLFLGLFALALANPVAQRPKFSLNLSEDYMRDFIEKIKSVDPRDISAVLNDYADEIFEHVKDFVIHSGLDPAEMPDITEGFNYTLIITFHGELEMTNGWLQDVSSMHRGGDVKVTYSDDNEFLKVVVPIAFDDLSFDYDYCAQIMDLGPTGGVEGKITDLEVEVAIGFDFVNYHASLDEFDITNSGQISLQFSGNGLVDWLVNLLIDVATVALHKIILLVIEGIVRNPISDIVDEINQLIDNLLHPTTPVDLLSF